MKTKFDCVNDIVNESIVSGAKSQGITICRAENPRTCWKGEFCQMCATVTWTPGMTAMDVLAQSEFFGNSFH